MKTTFLSVILVLLIFTSCSNKFVGIHCSEPQHSNLCLNLKKSGEFHYFFADDQGASEGYGEYFVKNKKLHLQFDEYGDQQDSIYLIKKKDLVDSISLEFIPIDTSFYRCMIEGWSGESYFALGYERLWDTVILKRKILFDQSLRLFLRDRGLKKIYFSINEPGEYEVYFKLKIGASLSYGEEVFDIKKNTKEELVIHKGDSFFWKWNLKKNYERDFYKLWRPYFRKRIVKKN